MAEEPADLARTRTPRAPLWTSAAIIAAVVWDVLTTGQWYDGAANNVYGMTEDHFLNNEEWIVLNSGMMALSAVAAWIGLRAKNIRAPATILCFILAALMAISIGIVFFLPFMVPILPESSSAILLAHGFLLYSKPLFWIGCLLIFARVLREVKIGNHSWQQ